MYVENIILNETYISDFFIFGKLTE